ncbi:hypothetical protein B0H14DRAFT_2721360, partial [Mycena olivaceomarginata]
ICTVLRVLETPSFTFLEWGLPVQFETTDDFLRDWADARKLAYSQCAGWIFWNFKIEESERAGDMAREWYKSHANVGSAIGLILKVFASGL